MQRPSNSSSEEKLSARRCRLRPDSSVSIGSGEAVSRASREHSLVGMRWHSYLVKPLAPGWSMGHQQKASRDASFLPNVAAPSSSS